MIFRVVSHCSSVDKHHLSILHSIQFLKIIIIICTAMGILSFVFLFLQCLNFSLRFDILWYNLSIYLYFNIVTKNWQICFYNSIYLALSTSVEKRLQALSFPSIGPSVCISAALTGLISVKYDIWDFYEDLLQNFRLL